MKEKHLVKEKQRLTIYPRFQFLPEWRLYKSIRWEIWAVGWIGVISGFFLIFASLILLSGLLGQDADLFELTKSLPAPLLVLASILQGIVSVLYGTGLWNLRKWARSIGIAFCALYSVSGIVVSFAAIYKDTLFSLFSFLFTLLYIRVTIGLVFDKQVLLNFELKDIDGKPLDFLLPKEELIDLE